MNHAIRIRMRSAEGAAVRALGLAERRGFQVVSISLEPSGEQHPAVVAEPRRERSASPRLRRDTLRPGEALGVLLQTLDAEQLAADRLFRFRPGHARQTPEAPVE